jgi:hypothetical protein
MAAILDALAEYNTGLVITVDEVGPDEPEMIQLAAIYQHLWGKVARFLCLWLGFRLVSPRLCKARECRFFLGLVVSESDA